MDYVAHYRIDMRSIGRLTFRHALETDVHEVASWIAEPEHVFLGVLGECILDNVTSWISEGTSLVLCAEHIGLVGFCNAVEVGTNQNEVGRLVVSPRFRRLGLGTKLIRRMLEELRGRGDKAIVRVHRDNEIGLTFFANLSFEKTSPKAEWADIDTYQWFQAPIWEGLDFFASKVRAHREMLGLQQKELFTRLGTSRSSLSDLENGRKWPSRELLIALLETLDLDEYEVVELLLSLVGRRPSRQLQVLAPIDSSVQTSSHLWVITDILAEMSIPGFYSATLLALRQGYQRIYFLDEHPYQFIEMLERDLSPKAKKSVKIFPAPKNLTNMRMVFADPDGIDAASLTVEGLDNTRISLSNELRRHYYKVFQRIVLENKTMWP